MLTYTYRYNRIIQWFKAHKPSADILCETHHIIPRSMGGDNSPDNLVDLPLRWHYIVHCWLPAMYAEQGNQEGYEKMLFAWNRMQNYRRGHRNALKCVKEDSQLYRKLREEFLQVFSERGKEKVGEKNPNFKHHWWKDPNDKTKSMSIKEGDPVPEGWVRGLWISDKARKNMSDHNATRGKRVFYNPQTQQKGAFAKAETIPDGWIPWKPVLNEETRRRMSEKAKAQRARERVQSGAKQRVQLEPMYEVYLTQGFKAVQDQFGYPYSHANFLQCVKRCMPEKFAYRFKNQFPLRCNSAQKNE